MPPQEKFSLLRTVLKTLGLSPEAIDDITDRIADFLSEKDPKAPARQVYPYLLRDDFVSRAEHSFFLVLKSVIPDTVLISPKVSLGDLFYVKSSDPSEYRTLTNKIDRKHVDFLLCDAKTLRPLAGIELDDKSHQRSDRQVRDEFVEQVFQAARLPLLRFPAQFSYSQAEVGAALRPYFGKIETPATPAPIAAPRVVPVAPVTPPAPVNAAPACPKCGSEMVLRTAKSGANAGEQFWGCPDYPKCRGVLKFEKG